MTTPSFKPRRRFDDLVPFYVSGQISAADREWVDQYLAAHPGAQAELAWHRDLKAEIAGKAEARAMQAPEMVGWARVEATLRAGRGRGQVVPTSWQERLRSWLSGMNLQRLAPVAAVLILVQGATIGTLVMRAPAGETQLIRSSSAVLPRDVLQVRFKPSVTEADLRALLYGASARIVDGPDQLGDYVLEPRRGTLDQLQAELQRSPLVQSLTPLKAWKPEPRDD